MPGSGRLAGQKITDKCADFVRRPFTAKPIGPAVVAVC